MACNEKWLFDYYIDPLNRIKGINDIQGPSTIYYKNTLPSKGPYKTNLKESLKIIEGKKDGKNILPVRNGGGGKNTNNNNQVNNPSPTSTTINKTNPPKRNNDKGCCLMF